MTNYEYRKTRGTDKPVNLTNAKAAWKQIVEERKANGWKDCIFTEYGKMWKRNNDTQKEQSS